MAVGPPPVWARAGARLVDELTVGIALAPLFVLADRVDPLILRTVPAAMTFLYFVLLEGSTGRTLGKLGLGLEVASAEGGAVTLVQAATRNTWILLRLIPEVGLFFMVAVSIYIALTVSSDPRGRGFHDRVSDTLVVRS